MARKHYWYDKSLRKMVDFEERCPPPRVNHYGDAPMVIEDTTDAYYHPGACRWTESKSEIKQFDRACGTITSDKKLAPDPTWANQQKAARRKDARDSLFRAVEQVDAGTAPMTEETRQLCERQNEILSKALNFDAFNVAGRKNNARGKKYRRR